MPVDVAGEGLGAVVHHLHRAAGAQRQHAEVDVHAHVLTRSEGAPHTDRVAPHLAGGDAEAAVDLLVVGVEPLADGPEVDAALSIGDGEARLGAEGSLVLLAHLVVPLDSDRSRRVRISAADPYVAHDRALLHSRFRIGEGRELCDVEVDRGRGAPCRVGIVGGDDGDRLTPEPDDAVREHRLVHLLEPELPPARRVGLGEDGDHPGHGERRSDVDPPYAAVSDRAAAGGPPEHAVRVEVGGEREVARHLGNPVRAQRALSDAAADRRLGGRPGHGARSASDSRARRMAP